MAVVQISRIQLRRGKKNSGTGLPQLASGELAWCIDTQELFIGNGSVGEGAPAVGNTKLLTEADSLLDLGTYSYKVDDSIIQTGEDVNFPVERTLQARLEDYVSSADYGIVSGSTDQYEKIQRIVDNLFLDKVSAGISARVTLTFLPGEYTFSQTVYLPSYVRIEGAGKNRTTFNYTGTGPAFAFINDTSTKTSRKTSVGIEYNLQAKFCYLKGFTINTTALDAVGFSMYCVRDSLFEDIEINGNYGTVAGTYTSSGIRMFAFSGSYANPGGVTCQRNIFSNVYINGFIYNVYAKQDIYNNRFSNCEFTDSRYGIRFGEGANGTSTGEEFGPRNNLIENSYFENIEREAIYVGRGYGNKSTANTFVNIGNDGGDFSEGVYSHIKFETHGNTSYQDKFDRAKHTSSEDAYDLSAHNYSTVYVKEVSGKGHFEDLSTRSVTLEYSPSFSNLIKIPYIDSAGFEITYVLESSVYNQMRRGSITLTVDRNTNIVRLVDDYSYVGTVNEERNVDFIASIDPSIGCIIIQYRNVKTGNTSNMTYTCRSIS